MSGSQTTTDARNDRTISADFLDMLSYKAEDEASFWKHSNIVFGHLWTSNNEGIQLELLILTMGFLIAWNA